MNAKICKVVDISEDDTYIYFTVKTPYRKNNFSPELIKDLIDNKEEIIFDPSKKTGITYNIELHYDDIKLTKHRIG